jgi:hypothetical protein
MSEMVITLLKVKCDEITDDFLEGVTDEFGFRVCAFDAAGDETLRVEEIPMKGLEKIEPRSVHEPNRELARVGPGAWMAQVEFWDEDTFGTDDLLGWIEIRRGDGPGLTLSPGESTEDVGGGAFRLTGEGGDYTVWLKVEER